MRYRSPWVVLTLLVAAAVACNLPVGSSTPEASGVPTITISTPASGSEFQVGEEVAIQSTASDTEGVVGVELQANGEKIRTDITPDGIPQASFSLIQSWVPSTPGDYTLSVIAYRQDGTTSDPASINVRVVEGGPTPTQQSTVCTARTNTDLNVRSGPSVQYPILGVLNLGSSANVSGRDEGAFWWQVQFSGGPGGFGWISAAYVTLSGDCSNVPFASYGPPPTQAATAAPTEAPTAAPGETPNTPVPTPPDLVVTAINMPSTILLPKDGSGTTVTIEVTVKNQGGQAATGFQTRLRPEGNLPFLPSVDLGLIASLGAGESFTFSTDYTYMFEGSYTVVAQVDPLNTVSESDEGNNIRTLGVSATVFQILIPNIPLQPILPLATP